MCACVRACVCVCLFVWVCGCGGVGVGVGDAGVGAIQVRARARVRVRFLRELFSGWFRGKAKVQLPDLPPPLVTHSHWQTPDTIGIKSV